MYNDQNLNVNCHSVIHVPLVSGLPQKKGLGHVMKSIKSVKGVSCVDQLPPVCHKCPHCCCKSICRVQTPVLGNIGRPRGQSQGHRNPQGRLHHPLLELANSDKISTNHKWACTSPDQQLPHGGMTCTYAETGIINGKKKSDISGFLKPTFHVETYHESELTEENS